MKKTLIITASAHIILLLGLIFVPSCQKKPKIIKPDIPINITEEQIAKPQQEEPKKETPKPEQKKVVEEPKKEEPKKEKPKPKPTVKKKEEPKKTVPKEKVKKKKVKKKKIIKKEPTKSLKEKIEEKLKKIDKKKPKTTKATSSAVKTTDLKAKNFPFKWYLDIVQHKVKTNWQEPGKAPGLANTITTTVSFTINKTGGVSNIKIHKPSSFPALDNSALKGVQNAKPFPPLPENYKKDSLDIIIKFNLSS